MIFYDLFPFLQKNIALPSFVRWDNKVQMICETIDILKIYCLIHKHNISV